MSSAQSPWPSRLILILGLALTMALGLVMTQRAQETARGFAQAHALAGQEGMRVWLYDNPFLSGQPQNHVKPPPRLYKPGHGEAMREYPFSWRWLARLEAPTPGEYVLDVYAPEAVRLLVDGRPVIQRWVATPPVHHRVLVDLDPGPHLIDLQNVQEKRRLSLSLLWLPPGGAELGPIPAAALAPLDDGVTPAQLHDLGRSVESWRAWTWLLPLLWFLLWLLVLRDPSRAGAALREHRAFLLILALAGVLRLIWADIVPGLNGESGHFLWRAELILEGARPFAGMNTRVGPLFEYILAPWVAALGPSVWLLRAAGGLLNCLGIVFLYRAADREAGRPAALAASLLVTVLPGLVMLSRMPSETTALGPLACFAGLYLLSLSRERPPMAVLAGVVWGLATFNHPIFIVVPFTLGLSGLLVSRGRALAWVQTWGLGAGFILGFLPRLYERLFLPSIDVISFTDLGRLKHFGGFMAIFARSLDGEVLYRTFTGRLLWDTYWILPLALLAALGYLAMRLWRDRGRGHFLSAWLGLALAIHLVMVPIGAASANPRYFLYCLIYAALLMGLAWGRAWEGVWGRRPLAAGLAGLTLLSLASLGVNYFHSHLATGGLPMEPPPGPARKPLDGLNPKLPPRLVWPSPLLDFTSGSWMNHRPLAEALAARGYPVVATGDWWHLNLHLSLNLYQGRPRSFTATDIASRSDTERAAVFYNSYEGRLVMAEYLDANPDKTYRRASLGPDLDRQYILLERIDPPVTFPPDLEEVW